MKQSTLFAMMSRPGPVPLEACANALDTKENKEESSSTNIESSESKDSNIAKALGNSKNKQNDDKKKSDSKRKRLRLAKQDKNEGQEKTVNLEDRKKVPVSSEKTGTPPTKFKEQFGSRQDRGETASEKEECPQNIPKSGKESMSYSDFLNMFQNPKPSSIIDEGDQELNGEVNNTENVKLHVKESGKKSDISNCKSIASYFKSSQSKLGAVKSDSTLVTIRAEVHASSTPQKIVSKKSLSSSPTEVVVVETTPDVKKPSAIEGEDIVLISSEIIDDDPSEKNQTQRAVKDKGTGKKTSGKDAIEKCSQNPVPKMVNNANLEKCPSQTAFQQSTLSFGKCGLSIICKSDQETAVNTAEPLQKDGANFPSNSFDKSPVIDKCDYSQNVSLDEGKSNLPHDKTGRIDDKDNTDVSKESDADQEKDVHKRQNRQSLRSIKSDSAEAKEAVDLEIQVDTPSTSSLRRSSRIKTNSEVKKKEIESMEIDSDSNEKTEARKPKKAKGQSSKSKEEEVDVMEIDSDTDENGDFQKSKKAKESNKKASSKPQGKLAPIFMRGKHVEEEPKKAEPPEDPEKVRARREFLMSGIPDELKRVIAATVSANIEADYPPFPQPSHVQQMTSETFPASKLTKTTFKLSSEKNEVFDHSWSKMSSGLGIAEEIRFDISQSSCKKPLEESQADLLLSEMETYDPTYPFREVYNTCKTKRNQDDSRSALADSEEIVVIDGDSPTVGENVKSDLSKDLIWCDLHQPCQSQEIIGNAKNIKQMKDWLTEWHNVMQKEVKKAAKGKRKQNRSSIMDAEWSADSDFTDSDEEDFRLCNTMLITGPHGIGKTSTVYGLAQEVGFKVFEVSASSLRSGKQLLSQLEEATQSHRVTSKKLVDSGIKGTPPAGGPKLDSQKPSSVKTLKTGSNSSAFANLFRKSNDSLKTADKHKQKISDEDSKQKKSSNADSSRKKTKKRKAKEKEEKEIDTKGARALNITSTSLILFDEADIVFEEDKGFLATVEHFMASTKIPIILTSTDSSLHLQLSHRHHNVIFKTPPNKSTINFLYTACLVHGIHIDYASLSNLVAVLKGDIRQCLLHLQFWCESGGGRHQVRESSNYQNKLTAVDATKQDVSSVVRDITGVDSLPGKPLRKRPRMIIDDDSNSSEASIRVSDQETLEETETRTTQLEKGNRLSRKRAGKLERDNMSQVKEKTATVRPLAHYGCDALLIGGTSQEVSSDSLVNILKVKFPSTSHLASVIAGFSSTRRHLCGDILYLYALHCCDLPRTSRTSTILEIPSRKQTNDCSSKKKRKRILSDVFDSEASDDEEARETDSLSDPSRLLNQVEEEDRGAKFLTFRRSISTEDGRTESDILADDVEMKKDDRKPVKNEESSADYLFNVKVLSQFSRLFDDRSCMSLLEGALSSVSSVNDLKPGVEDQLSVKDGLDWKTEDTLQDIYAYIDVLSARKFTAGVSECVESRRENHAPGEIESASWKEEWDLPIGTSLPDLWGYSREEKAPSRDQDPTMKNIKDCLGLWSHGSNPCISIDYLPMLREVCRFEANRQAAHKKRRFYHYFDHIGLGLKESTVASLASTYRVIESDS